jgi:hypothetical protein
MSRGFLHVGLLMGTLSLGSMAAAGQAVVHALAGKVTAIYPGSSMIKVTTDDGSEGMFGVLTKTDTPLNFQKGVKALTTPAGAFTKTNVQVVVFYFGNEGIRTTVALEDLGTAPLQKSEGTVVRLDKHAHVLTIISSTGEEQTFQIDAKTIADGAAGVVEGQKCDLEAGTKVRVTATTANGTQTALFIRALSL